MRILLIVLMHGVRCKIPDPWFHALPAVRTVGLERLNKKSRFSSLPGRGLTPAPPHTIPTLLHAFALPIGGRDLHA